MNSQKQFELNLQSPAFEEFNENLNKTILACLRELHAGKFIGGEIAAKISIELQSDSEYFAVGTDDKGKPKYKSYQFNKPEIDHKVTLTLKKRDEIKGTYSPSAMELKQDNGRLILSAVTKAQLSLDDVVPSMSTMALAELTQAQIALTAKRAGLDTITEGKLPESKRSTTITPAEAYAAVDSLGKVGEKQTPTVKLTAKQWIEKELSTDEYNAFIKRLVDENDHEHPTYEEWRKELEPDVIKESKALKKKGVLK